MASNLSAPHFHNEEAAYLFVEKRIWPNGPVCPRCNQSDRVGKMGGQSTRIGTYKCYACRKPFTVKVGTVFESSHVPMRLWLEAIFLIASSKEGISANQLHRTLGITLKSAWFLGHRIREVMKDDGLIVFGHSGGDVEADETYIGRDPTKKLAPGSQHKMKALSLVDRKTRRKKRVVVAKRKPRSKPKPRQDDPEQSRRFVETARELEADESAETFERVVDALSQRPVKRKTPDT